MKYAVLGAAGQLGRDLGPRLAGDVVPLDRGRADLTNADQLRTTLQELRPDVVVNCAAYNFVDKAESEPDAACAVNAWGVRNLARVCRDLDCVLAHFSTDYVFGLDTQRTTPFQTAAALIATDHYGLYHVTNSGATTWYELAKAALELANVHADLTPIPSSGYPTPARRPGYSVLALDALTAAGVSAPRDWRAAVAAY